MKRIKIFLLFSLISIMASAQSVNTMWPYLFNEFRDGTIYTKDGFKFDRKVNVHVLKSTLHYLDGNNIKETSSSDLLMLDSGEDMFMCVDGQVMRVVAGDEEGFVATLVLGDFSKVAESGGAYGASSNTLSTMELTSVDLGGINIIDHMRLKNNKESGKKIPLMTSYFIVAGERVYPANKNKIRRMLDKELQKQFKDFIKEKKINWNRAESLMLLVDFLKDID
jgi:hypothetical protein